MFTIVSAGPRAGGALMKNPRTLLDMPSGSMVRVCALNGDCKELGRLCSLGITPGTKLKAKQAGDGNCCVQVRECNLVLCSGIAENVFCEPAGEADGAPSRGVAARGNKTQAEGKR